MTKKQRLPLLTIAMLLGAVIPAAAAGPPAPTPTKGEKAGAITALLPIARIQRGAGKAMVTTEAKKGDEVIWNDDIKTERGGRARITLNDQSILSLGSQAELRIVKHDARSQQTALALQYGRIRAEVAKVTRQGGSFELRTPTAVAGVIGTDFGTDASTPGVTTFLCISGVVQVSNSDPNIAGSVQCTPGLTTTVTAGKAPTPPQNATPAQIQQLIQDTEPAIIAAMSPMSALPGAAVDVTITGTKLGAVQAATPSGAGLTTTIVGTPTDTSVTVHVVVAATAQPGPQMITLSKSNGAASAAMFTIMAPPVVAQSGDLKKPYVDQLTQEGQTARGGLSSFLAAVQQVADQALQQLQQQNTTNVNISSASTAFNNQLSVLENALNTAGQQIDQATAQASTTFQEQYNAIYQALLQRHPDGTPDQQFNDALQALFASVNSSLGNTFAAINSNLRSVVTTTNTGIAQAQQTWMQTLTAASNPPVPQVNSIERSIDVGAAFGGPGISALDASNSKPQGGASIVSYKWVLCDPSYKPAQFGVPLAGAATAGCNPLSGYASSSSDFQFSTCNLGSGDYIARVTIADSNSSQSAMDVKVHVLQPTYDDPATRVRNLAQAYVTLQQNNFLSFFDETGFSGFTSLQQNIQNTFPLLASMQINPRISQAAVTCNDATVRADWVQNYTYKANPNIPFSQTEQLSIRMTRQPGKGWYIVDFQGDNGTVQGQLPGPAVVDTALPNLTITTVYPTAAGPLVANPPVPPGAQSFTATVQNAGTADFTANTVVHFELRDNTNALIGTGVDVPLPVPLAAGASTTVQATLTVPALALGTNFTVVANVNPAATGESRYDDNLATEAVVIGVGKANYVITSVTFANHTVPYTGANAFQVGESTNLIVVVQNAGDASPTGTVTVTGSCVPLNPNDTKSCSGGGNPTATVAAPAAGQSVTATMPVDFKGMLPGSFTGTAALTTSITQSSTTDDTASVSFDVTDFTVTVLNPISPQYILPGANQTVTVRVNTVGTTVYPLTVTPVNTYTGVTYTPATTTVSNGGTATFTVTASGATPVGAFGAIINGVNYGVTHPGTEPFVVMAPQIVSTNLFLNDSANPLEIQIGNPTPADVSLKLSGASFSGTATIIPPTSVVGFTTTLNPTTSILANGTLDLTVSASSSATSVVTPLVVTAQLPNTNPVLSISYTLYVKAVGLPDLAIVSATPSVNFSSAPWIDGQGVDWTVQVQNIGSSTSAGGEEVAVQVNGYTAGTNKFDVANQLKALAPQATQTITVHAVAPDIHGNTAFGPQTISGRVRVAPEPVGEANYTNNSFAISVPMANWHFSLNQTSPVQLAASTGGGTTTVYFAGAIDGSSFTNYPTLTFVPAQGQVSSAFSLTSFAQPPNCGNAPANTQFCAVVATASGTLQPGPYFAQMVVTLTDPITGQNTVRQATVPLQVNTGTSGATISVASSANNCSGTNCSTTGNTLQVNGGLSEQFSLTLSMTCVNPLNGQVAACSGVGDLVVHDATNTQTTPMNNISAVPTGTPVVLRVAAATDPAGNIATGPAGGYSVSVASVQHNVAPRPGNASTPDPVGVTVPFNINVGDLSVTANTGANSCSGVVFNGTPLQLTVQWTSLGGFNAPSLTYQWEDGNHTPVGAAPLSFSNPAGTISYSGAYSPVTFSLTNTQAKDGAQPYFLAVTISNGTSTATKYFPFYFDLSLGQNFCGAAAAARSYSPVRGSWGRANAAASIAPIASVATPSTSASDVHISASDVSFTPSMPKVGDTVQVRFRASNTGDADAKSLPIALQVNGAIVASDTFDLPKGHTVLGGLTWTATADVLRRAPASDVRRASARVQAETGDAPLLGTVPLQAAIVVDPQHTTRQKSTLDKSAAVSHLTLRGSGSGTAAGATAASSQRILIELEDGACVGLRLSSGGTMPCGSADLEITIGDLARSLLSFESLSGVADTGTAFESGRRSARSGMSYGAQAAAMSGHTYSVQLANGNTAVVHVESVRNPAELDAKAQAVFRASAARVMRSMGDSSTPVGPGDLTGNGTHATVFIVLTVQGT